MGGRSKGSAPEGGFAVVSVRVSGGGGFKAVRGSIGCPTTGGYIELLEGSAPGEQLGGLRLWFGALRRFGGLGRTACQRGQGKQQHEQLLHRYLPALSCGGFGQRFILNEGKADAMDFYLARLQEAIQACLQEIEEHEPGPPREGKWSAAEILEHLYLTYTGTIKG